MPRSCVACSHPDQAAIDQAIVSGEPFRRIGTRFEISEASVRRHKRDHLPVAVSKAHEVEEEVRGDDLLGQVRSLQQKALDILKTAEQAGDLKVALGAIREARGCMELLAKLVYVLAKDREGEEARVNYRFTIGKGYEEVPPITQVEIIMPPDSETERTETVDGIVTRVE